MKTDSLQQEDSISVVIRFAPGNGPVKAYADVTLHLEGGSLTVIGFAVIVKNGQRPYVGFPKKEGRVKGKYFPIVEADGAVEKAIIDAVLTEYNEATRT